MKNILIEKLVAGGDGLGRIDGVPVFVPLSAPGDLITTGSVRHKRGVSFASIREVVRGSPLRRDPPCPYFTKCGGCSWMHMSYAAQVEWKGKILNETLRRIGGIEIVPEAETVSSPSEFQWRHRIRLHHRNGGLGFFRRGTHDLVRWDRCLIIPETLNRAAAALRTVTGEEGRNLPVDSVELAVSPVDQAVSVLWQIEKGKGSVDIDELMSRTRTDLDKAGLDCSCQAVSSGSPPQVKGLAGTPLMLSSGQCTTLASPGTFFQVNPHQNKTLVAKVLSILRDRGVRRMVDLFCGNGNFSIPASLEGVRVTGVEFFPGAVADAKTAMEDGEIVFFNSDVESFLTANPDMSADAVLVDPPRAGLSSLVRDALLRWAPETIVYVSCDPATLARDLRSFLESGYNLTSVKGFDMFPNSAHIEALAVLERK